MKIGVDIDGVIAEQNVRIYEYLRDKYNYTGDAQVSEWNPYIEEVGMTYSEIFHEAIDEIDNFYLEMEAIPGSIETLKMLSNNHKLIILTHRPKRTHEDSKKWLQKFGIKYHKFVEDVPEDKTKATNIDTIIDDRVPVVNKSKKNNIPAFLFYGSHNHYKNITKYHKGRKLIFTAVDFTENKKEPKWFVSNPSIQWKAFRKFVTKIG